MHNYDSESLDLLRKIYGVLELLAEDKIAERDAKQRSALRQLAGASLPKKKSILLMDGTRTQAEIHSETSINKGHLSTLVGALNKANLLTGDPKKPNLVISLPSNFFDDHADAN
ncbi:hypothetical protein [Oricola nitratireducens]|uniref:hypothetical protein n=1 Tax=Oricola nitratireducens TaxID=2775868 RepID=UPI001869654B|nr:hypothetical protein [Oricola nitratireducens]